MRPAMNHSKISAVRAEALFVSALQRCEHPSAGQVRQAVATAICVFGKQGCAERVAQEFGDHPETAVDRMRWARRLAGKAFGSPRASAGPRPDTRPASSGSHPPCRLSRHTA